MGKLDMLFLAFCCHLGFTAYPNWKPCFFLLFFPSYSLHLFVSLPYKMLRTSFRGLIVSPLIPENRNSANPSLQEQSPRQKWRVTPAEISRSPISILDPTVFPSCGKDVFIGHGVLEIVYPRFPTTRICRSRGWRPKGSERRRLITN